MKKINVKQMALKTAGTTAGAVAGATLNKVAFIGNQKPVVRAALKIALAAILPGLMKAKAGSLVENAANGMMAVGGLELANNFIKDPTKKFSIAGIGDLPALGGVGADISFDENYVSGIGSGTDDEIDIE